MVEDATLTAKLASVKREFAGEWPSIWGVERSDMRWPIRDLAGFKAAGASASVLSARSRYASQ